MITSGHSKKNNKKQTHTKQQKKTKKKQNKTTPQENKKIIKDIKYTCMPISCWSQTHYVGFVVTWLISL
jgi:hypothetical protein